MHRRLRLRYCPQQTPIGMPKHGDTRTTWNEALLITLQHRNKFQTCRGSLRILATKRTPSATAPNRARDRMVRGKTESTREHPCRSCFHLPATDRPPTHSQRLRSATRQSYHRYCAKAPLLVRYSMSWLTAPREPDRPEERVRTASSLRRSRSRRIGDWKCRLTVIA